MYLEFDTNNHTLIVRLIGELDHHGAETVRNKIDDKLDIDNCTKLIMDFSQVTFMDSSGIGAVIGRYKKLIANRGKLGVVNVEGVARRVFELSGMFKIIPLYDDIEQAVKEMQ